MKCIKNYLSEKCISRYLLSSVIIVMSCNYTDTRLNNDTSYVSEIQNWHQERIEQLKEQNGILSVTGLYWLKDGENSVGSDTSNYIVLSKDIAPDFIGSFSLSNGKVIMKVKPGIEVMSKGEYINEMVLNSDMDSGMTILSLGKLNWFIIERNKEFGVRFRDNDNQRIEQFKNIEIFEIDPAWRFEAYFEPYEQVKIVPSVTPSGAIRDFPSNGAFVININDNTYRLDPISLPNSDSYLLIFGDKTNGEETYGGGRFLYVKKHIEHGKIIIDFNKSINPPCAISEYFVCPLPPSQNRLPFKVTAGEKKYDVHRDVTRQQ